MFYSLVFYSFCRPLVSASGLVEPDPLDPVRTKANRASRSLDPDPALRSSVFAGARVYIFLREGNERGKRCNNERAHAVARRSETVGCLVDRDVFGTFDDTRARDAMR